MRPPCLAAGACLTPEARGANLYPYLWIAGYPPLPLERRNQPLRRADQTAHPRVASRPRGNQPSIALALIERAPHGNTGINRIAHPLLNSTLKPGNAAAKRRRESPVAAEVHRRKPPPKRGANRAGNPPAPPARASSPQGCQRTAPPGSRPSGDQPPTLDTSEYPLTRPCPAAPAGINRKRRALPQELEPPPSQEGIRRGHSCQDRRP